MPNLPEKRDDYVKPQLEYISARTDEIPEEVLEIATRLSKIHGRVRVTKEKNGVHFYIASPACLTEYGLDELYKMHLAINVEKWHAGEDLCALCMKTRTPYTMTDLISMQPLKDRGYDATPEVIYQAVVDEAFLEDDGKGNKIPKGPGLVYPVFQLPAEHPAMLYLRSRHFCPMELYRQFRLSFCEKERLESHMYRNLLNGFRATPQGRVIFFADVNGVNRGWQGRVLEVEDATTKWFYHPYDYQWTAVMQREGPGQAWSPLPGWEGWEMPKYMIGRGCHRNEMLLGYDAAVQWNLATRQGHKRVAVLAEGALDAGRPGPPGIALLGKFLSAEQARLLALSFEVIIYVSDTDKAGEQAKSSVASMMGHHPDVRLFFVDAVGDNIHGAPAKDLGELPKRSARALINGVFPVWRTDQYE